MNKRFIERSFRNVRILKCQKPSLRVLELLTLGPPKFRHARNRRW